MILSLPTPLNRTRILELLKIYPVDFDREFLSSGFCYGFRIPVMQRPDRSFFVAERGMCEEYRSILNQLMKREIRLGRVNGPFARPPWATFISTPVFLVPKSSPGKFRIIHDLSCKGAPEAPNQLISDEFAAVQYASFDHAINLVAQVGYGAFMGKQDIAEAFKLLPVAPVDYYLLGFQLNQEFYYETVLPFGCRCSCLYSFILWEWLRRKPKILATKYLDDLFTVNASYEGLLNDWRVLEGLAQEVSLPLAEEKKAGPSTSVIYLGLEIDSVEGVVRLPQDKTGLIFKLIDEVLRKTRVSLKLMQRLLGHLCFASRAVPMGRPFLRRLYAFLSVFTSVEQKRRLGKDCRSDLLMWRFLFKNSLGPFKIFNRSFLGSDVLQLYTDSSGACGYGAVLGYRWFFGNWTDFPVSCTLWSIAALEFVPIILAMGTWKSEFAGKKINIHSDNSALVTVLNSRTAADSVLLALLRIFVILCVNDDIEVIATHVPGKENVGPDLLSRGQMDRFLRTFPRMEKLPSLVPNSCWSLFNNFCKF